MLIGHVHAEMHGLLAPWHMHACTHHTRRCMPPMQRDGMHAACMRHDHTYNNTHFALYPVSTRHVMSMQWAFGSRACPCVYDIPSWQYTWTSIPGSETTPGRSVVLMAVNGQRLTDSREGLTWYGGSKTHKSPHTWRCQPEFDHVHMHSLSRNFAYNNIIMYIIICFNIASQIPACSVLEGVLTPLGGGLSSFQLTSK